MPSHHPCLPTPASEAAAEAAEELLEATQVESSQVRAGSPARESGEPAQQQPASDDESMTGLESNACVNDDYFEVEEGSEP